MRPVPSPPAAAAAVLLLGLVGLVGLVGGCGFDVSQDDDRAPDPAVVRTGLAGLYAGPSPSAELAAEGTCFAAALEERLPLDDLVAAGLVGDDGVVVAAVPMLEVDVARAWVGAIGACTSYAEVAARSVGSPGVVGVVDATCLGAAVPDEQLSAALVAALTGRFGSDPASEQLAAARETCTD